MSSSNCSRKGGEGKNLMGLWQDKNEPTSEPITRISVYIDVTAPLVISECFTERWLVSANCRRPPTNQCLPSPSQSISNNINQMSPVQPSGRITRNHGMLYGRRLAVHENIKHCDGSIVLLPITAKTIAVLPVVAHKPIQFIPTPFPQSDFERLHSYLTYCVL